MVQARKTISFYTLGCRLNQSETAVLERCLEADGFKIVDFNAPADVVVINTCTVTENGDRDTRRLVNKINRVNPKTRIALVGCQAQIQKEKLTRMPGVRWVVGNARKMDLAVILRAHADDEPQVIAPAIPRGSFTVPLAGIDSRHTRANIKIQDGCDFFCSFCEIPYARGRARSREFNDIIVEAKALAAAGHKELVMTGINAGTYRQNGRALVDVIDALEQIDGIHRIRISSIEPTTISQRIIEKMARGSKLCRYLHIPLQSGSNQILKAMKRKYTAEEWIDFIEAAHARVPQICIGTDIIVGFPGEGERQFEESVACLRDRPVHYAHIFSYSKRSMARSRRLPDEVPAPEIQRRSRILRELSARKRRMFHESLRGTTQKVLFEQKKNELWTGLSDHYARVLVSSDKPLANQVVDVKITGSNEKMIFGEIR